MRKGFTERNKKMLIQGAKLGDLLGNQLTIEIPLHSVEDLQDFKPDELVTVEIKRPKDKRTLQQNKYIWEIIGQIDKRENGYKTDIMSIYISLIKQARVKTVYFQTNEQARSYLDEQWRHVEEIETRTFNGKESKVYECYPGTSKFTKREMADFIEVLITRAYETGIDVYNYENVLRGSK